MKYKQWTKIPWDGNTSLGFECYRKSFGKGDVSVGIGEFTLICYSYGNNSDDSMSNTRWNYDLPPITEQDAMDWVDECGGKYTIQTNPKNRASDEYIEEWKIRTNWGVK